VDDTEEADDTEVALVIAVAADVDVLGVVVVNTAVGKLVRRCRRDEEDDTRRRLEDVANELVTAVAAEDVVVVGDGKVDVVVVGVGVAVGVVAGCPCQLDRRCVGFRFCFGCCCDWIRLEVSCSNTTSRASCTASLCARCNAHSDM
jgi:hypothetical protein